MYIVHQYKRT